MTSPAEGLLAGTTRRTRTSPEEARSRTASSSFAPASVRFATTRTSLTARSLPRRRPYHRARARRRSRWSEHPVHRAGHAVLVRPADDRGHAVEVEDRRRRGHLPLERHPAPWVCDRDRSSAPARDDVVDEDERREPEAAARDRDEQVQVGKLR